MKSVDSSPKKYAAWWIHAVAYFFSLLFLTPFIWLVLASLTPSSNLLDRPLRWWPSRFDFSRWVDIATGALNSPAGGFRIAMANSLIIAAGTALVCTVVSVYGAYALSRLRFQFKRPLLLVFLTSYMMPPIAIIIPLYLILARLHLLDSKIGLIIVYSSFITPFVMWTLTSFLNSIPMELDEAATIDGASKMMTLRSILLPLMRPGLFSAVLFAVLLCWDEFLYALIFTSTSASKTIPIAVAEFSGKYSTDFGLVAAGGVLAAIPPVVVALIFQRQVTAGLAAGAVKG
ncbi:MAG TPA: carbohydrate ABC transporter permease [Candidatus Paceibacterota bacterium]|nr:carbohydrate ABC transporter permease [Candidatus Paceibacterota bacterium]